MIGDQKMLDIARKLLEKSKEDEVVWNEYCTLPEPEGLRHKFDHGLKQLANFSRTSPANPTSLKFTIQ